MKLKELIERHPNGVLELGLVPYNFDEHTFSVELDKETLKPHKYWRICSDGMSREAKEACWAAAKYELEAIAACLDEAEWEETDGKYFWVYGDVYPDGDPSQPAIDATLWFFP